MVINGGENKAFEIGVVEHNSVDLNQIASKGLVFEFSQPPLGLTLLTGPAVGALHGPEAKQTKVMDNASSVPGRDILPESLGVDDSQLLPAQGRVVMVQLLHPTGFDCGILFGA